MAGNEPRARRMREPQPAADVTPLADAFTASVRGAFMSGSDAMLDQMWEVAREEFAKGMPDASPQEAQALGELTGAAFIRDSQYRSALSRYEDLLESARDGSNPRAESRALYNLGVAHSRLREYDVAERLFEQARTVGQSIPDDECVAFAEIGLSAMYEHTDRLPEAEKLRECAVADGSKSDDPRFMMRLLIGPEASLVSEEAMEAGMQELFEQRGRPEPGHAFEVEGDKARRQGRMEAARVAYRRLLVVAGGSGLPRLQVRALTKLALTYMDEHDWPNGLNELQQALDLQRQVGPPAAVARLMSLAAGITARSGDSEGAIARYIEAYRFCQKNEDVERLRQIAAEMIAVAEKYDLIERFAPVCAEHGLGADEFARLLDEGEKWLELHGGPVDGLEDEP